MDKYPQSTGCTVYALTQRTACETGHIAGYYLSVRLAGTAITCILAAFGAAFLVARAVNHQTPARAATAPTHVARAAAAVTTNAPKVNVELVSQFSPIKGSKLKPRPKPKPKHREAKPKPQVSVAPAAPSTTTTATPTPTYTAPVYSPPPPPAPTHSSSGATHHKKSSGGSGTTTIGG